jgi:HK97 family phage major capsid protein
LQQNPTEIAEGGLYPEATFVLTERQVVVRKIGVWIPATEEQFGDAPLSRDYINSRLVRAINERADNQILNGNGTPPNIQGILNTASVQTQAMGADTALTAIRRAIRLIRVNALAEPDAVVINPTDWEEMQLATATGGSYVAGFPFGMQTEGLWGLPVVSTPAIAVGTALVGAFRACSELVLRRRVDIQVSNSHTDFFTNGKLAIRADFRAALVVYRPAAFCRVTGI